MMNSYPEPGSEGHKELIEITLQTIYVLLESNPETKKRFKQEIGYNQLYDILLCVEPEETSSIIMDKILQLLLETSDNNYKSITIKSPESLEVFLRLITHCNSDNQKHYLNILYQLLTSERSELNLSLTSLTTGSPLLDLLLDTLPNIKDDVINLLLDIITIVASHGITIHQLKRIFRLMKNTGNERPYYAMKFLTVLHNILLNNINSIDHGSSRYFLFEGIDSGLIVTSSYIVNNSPIMRKELPLFPYSGYTFSLWFNCASLSCPWLQDSSSIY